MNAFVVGCQRSGTTYLAEMLDQHPRIRMVRPLQPEPKFFLSADNCRRGSEYYHELYGRADEGTVVCEKTCSYMEHDEIPGRIRACFPGASILILLRNPVERAISHYRYSVDNGLECRSIEEAMFGPEPSERPAAISMSPYRYVSRSRYVHAVGNYLRHFPRTKVLITESIVGNADGIREVYEFLGANHGFVPRDVSRRVNAGVRGGEVSKEVRHRLAELLMPQVEELERLLDADLRKWWG